jgi:phage protein D
MAGNTEVVSGVNITLSGVGKFSGKWHVTSSTHKVDGGGYTTEVTAYKIR